VDTRKQTKFTAGQIRSYDIQNAGASVTAQAFSAAVQALSPAKNGYLTVFSGAIATPPAVSSVNYQVSRLTLASVYSAVSSTGVFKVRSTQAVHVVVDVTGYFAPVSTNGLWYFPVTPHRFFDTRTGSALSATSRTFTIRGVGSVPAAAKVISYAAALPKPSGTSELHVWPSGATPATTAGVFNLGLTGQTAGLVPIGTDDKIRLSTKAATVHAAFDVDGYFASTVGASSLGFVPLKAPIRIIDTRATKWHGLTVLNVTVRPKLPNDAKVLVCTVSAITRNVTGSLTIWPQGTKKPATSYLQYNGKLLKVNSLTLNIFLSSTGGFSMQSSCAGDVIIDAIGYYMPYNAPVVVRAAPEESSTQHSGLPGYAIGLIVVGAILAATLVVVILIIVFARSALRKRTNSIKADSYISMVANSDA